MPHPVTTRAHAKINLMLSVGPPLPPEASRPGWHEIASWFHAIDLYDDVAVEPLSGGPPLARGTVETAWAPDALRPTPIDWPPEKDLAARAHACLEQHVGRSLPSRLHVTKRIPTGAGLGGGSSDAAATLRALNEAFDLSLDQSVLRTLGATLGSDVPYFLDDHAPPRPALVTGFGETIERTDRADAALVLVVPPYSCSTPDVYKAFDTVLDDARRERELDYIRASGARATEGRPPGRPPEPHRVKTDLVRRRMGRLGTRPDPGHLFNDLALAAYRVEPRLGELVTTLARVTRISPHVTGSGSAIFLLTDRPEKTLEQARRVLPEGAAARICRLC
ncbi:MAG: 4-diphosphocytidyl-2-C-methyl-D-erythritol kinase [Phycisphaerae bacterium]|nr:MAG: 4-diphosphocytidyl-2-C-methyl-D-erythritol kinase [Phycisphaerae bacterium]